jgi:hypothetical protein
MVAVIFSYRHFFHSEAAESSVAEIDKEKVFPVYTPILVYG